MDEYLHEQVNAFNEVIGFAEEAAPYVTPPERRENLVRAISRSKDLLIDYLVDRLSEEEFSEKIRKALQDESFPRVSDN